jgi:glutamate-1-semialdehyde 2,1-aminomutase
MNNEAPNSAFIIRQSEAYIAGGVVSLNRKARPAIVFARAEGAYLYDADGGKYLDYHAAFAPHLLGHHHPEITEAVRAALDRGWSLMGSGTTPWEAELSQLLCEAVPGLERVQILNTGSEASSLAIRLARAYTGREDVVVTLGGYNGWHDEVGRAVMPSLAEIGPRRTGEEYPLLPISAGIPASTQRRIHTVNFNDLESVEAVFKKHSVACLITEPVLQNIGVVPPRPGYLQGLRELCDRYQVVMVMDEVKAGFRSALGGYQAVSGVTPDLSLFGKAVANGYPLGVLGGKAEIMELFASPDLRKRVLVAGTYNGHAVNVAAAIATLQVLKRDGGAVYSELKKRAGTLQAGLEVAFRNAGYTATVVRNASALCYYFMDHTPRDWHDVLEHHDFAKDNCFRLGLIEEGVYFFPAACKQVSVSAAHSDDDIARTLKAVQRVIPKLS